MSTIWRDLGKQQIEIRYSGKSSRVIRLATLDEARALSEHMQYDSTVYISPCASGPWGVVRFAGEGGWCGQLGEYAPELATWIEEHHATKDAAYCPRPRSWNVDADDTITGAEGEWNTTLEVVAQNNIDLSIVVLPSNWYPVFLPVTGPNGEFLPYRQRIFCNSIHSGDLIRGSEPSWGANNTSILVRRESTISDAWTAVLSCNGSTYTTCGASTARLRAGINLSEWDTILEVIAQNNIE